MKVTALPHRGASTRFQAEPEWQPSVSTAETAIDVVGMLVSHPAFYIFDAFLAFLVFVFSAWEAAVYSILLINLQLHGIRDYDSYLVCLLRLLASYNISTCARPTTDMALSVRRCK